MQRKCVFWGLSVASISGKGVELVFNIPPEAPTCTVRSLVSEPCRYFPRGAGWFVWLSVFCSLRLVGLLRITMKALYFVPIQKSIWSPTRGRPRLVLSDIEDYVSDKIQSTLFRILHSFQGCFLSLLGCNYDVVGYYGRIHRNRRDERGDAKPGIPRKESLLVDPYGRFPDWFRHEMAF